LKFSSAFVLPSGVLEPVDFSPCQMHRPLGSSTVSRQGFSDDVRARRAAYRIIAGKGLRDMASGGLARIVPVIRDQRAVLTLSIHRPDVAHIKDIALSLPRVV
jgi:hypothetical protein